MSKWRLWLIQHGIEWEWSDDIYLTGGFERHVAIIINHRYYTLNLMVNAYRGVFRDELNKSHAEIAAERERTAND
jgi:hypothetical protein